MKKLKVLLWLCPVLLFGCQKDAPVDDLSGSKPPPATKTEQKGAEVGISEVLKHEGFRYYGLDNAKPVNLQVTGTTMDGILTGSQTRTLKEVKGDVASFAIDRTGQLVSSIGAQQEVEVRKDGIYATSVEGNKVEPPQMELPAELVAGKTWNVNSAFDTKNGKIAMKAKFEVIKKAKIKTKLGEHEAWLVRSIGEYTTGGQVLKVQTDTWYAEGIGEVKMTMDIKSPTKSVMTVEATQ